MLSINCLKKSASKRFIVGHPTWCCEEILKFSIDGYHVNSVLKHDAFEKRFLVHWLIVVTSLGLFFYLYLDSKSNNETALAIDDLSYVKGQFTEVVCLKGSSRSVDSIDFTFAVKGGDVMKATGAIRSTLSCRDEIVDLLVNAPSSREAELWGKEIMTFFPLRDLILSRKYMLIILRRVQI